MVTVELYGVPRLRAGVAELVVEAATVGELFASLSAAVPALADLLHPRLGPPTCLVSVDGERFTTDPNEVLPDGCRVIMLTADAGG